MEFPFQLKSVKIKEIQDQNELIQSVPDLSYHYVSSTTILLHFQYEHFTNINNMSFVPAGVKVIERNRCFVLSNQEIRKINGFTNKSNTALEQKASSRVA